MSDLLKEMQDRQEIIDLTIAYAWLLDHGPRERLDTVFTEDAVCDYMSVVVEGLPAIIEKVRNALGDTATCRCYLHAQHTLRGTEGGDNFVIAGRYDDELIRTDDGWRITFRKLSRDWVEGNPGIRQPS